ncbi:7599_t:CDS:2 [Dentiscutata erythropus]|uniref:7599_t:CDS:1 n=1 Tax=Dentiscutata erythropus TaxID=1348616 RepID=A0A9N9FG51_9GLOM|nr:7599_t:CDS:2 [Dentiscutata erythropus]
MLFLLDNQHYKEFDKIFQQETIKQFKPFIAYNFCGKYYCLYFKTILNDIEI